MTPSQQYAAMRKPLRAKINAMQDGPEKTVSKQIDGCLRSLAIEPGNKEIQEQLEKNMVRLEVLKNALASDERQSQQETT